MIIFMIFIHLLCSLPLKTESRSDTLHIKLALTLTVERSVKLWINRSEYKHTDWARNHSRGGRVSNAVYALSRQKEKCKLCVLGTAVAVQCFPTGRLVAHSGFVPKSVTNPHLQGKYRGCINYKLNLFNHLCINTLYLIEFKCLKKL